MSTQSQYNRVTVLKNFYEKMNRDHLKAIKTPSPRRVRVRSRSSSSPLRGLFHHKSQNLIQQTPLFLNGELNNEKSQTNSTESKKLERSTSLSPQHKTDDILSLDENIFKLHEKVKAQTKIKANEMVEKEQTFKEKPKGKIATKKVTSEKAISINISTHPESDPQPHDDVPKDIKKTGKVTKKKIDSKSVEEEAVKVSGKVSKKKVSHTSTQEEAETSFPEYKKATGKVCKVVITEESPQEERLSEDPPKQSGKIAKKKTIKMIRQEVKSLSDDESTPALKKILRRKKPTKEELNFHRFEMDYSKYSLLDTSEEIV
ncbi:hypothetical protein EIN_430480 [Entamoeba invadens IP1]|uniref:Uncharacterized protein n=1 Tax=Entamoeba invadens IP1 TaxID=370355 RepID=A0A0A1UHF7_ENTIV|nr:hypothetical protein EIN_430480 [Entamoeba invadens IP1]ELP95242.1 hypothetical protein EIN_430480 [Entamoeba invadens IP1]|eukprot:XP_004262013.1 hypothetical protein EIN_430480 [Entamoeba invadens IP1]